MKTINDHKYSQRAVAPIIATLLMVAISVVGGILIFVFAQGFFTDTNIASPTIETLSIFGYDATNSVTLKPHNFDPTVTTAGTLFGPQTVNAANTGTSIGKLIDADKIALYIRNTGTHAVVLSSINIFGAQYSPDSAACTATAPIKLKFSVSPSGLAATSGTNIGCEASPIVEPGRDVTVYIAYDETANGKVKIGRPLPVIVVTANGATFAKQVQLGIQIGG